MPHLTIRPANSARATRSSEAHSQVVRIARFCLCASMLPFLFGCAAHRGQKQAEAPSPAPPPQQTATPAASPTPWPAGIPYPVAVDPDRISADLLTWLDPSRGPRLESWRFLRREDLRGAWPEDRPLFDDASDASSPVDPAGPRLASGLVEPGLDPGR